MMDYVYDDNSTLPSPAKAVRALDRAAGRVRQHRARGKQQDAFEKEFGADLGSLNQYLESQ